MRIIKKLIIYTTIIGAFLLSILVVFGFLYQDEIVDSVKVELNKQLNAEVQVGDFNLSFISNFPSASIDLNNITGYESRNFSDNPDTLFHFEKFSLSFDVIGILRGIYNLNQIRAVNGFLNLEIDKKGQKNFLIFKSDTSNTEFYLNLQKLTLTNVDIGYNDFNTKDNFQFHFPNIIAKGLITDTKINAALYGETKVKELVLNNTSYLHHELGRVDIGIEIDLESNIVQVSRGYITLRDKYQFDVKGISKEGSYHYTFDAKSLNLATVEEFIPAKHIEFINKFNLDGIIDLFVKIERNPNNSKPSISGNYSIIDGVLENKNTKVAVHVRKGIGTFDLGKKTNLATTTISASELEFSTDEGSAIGAFTIYNLKHPEFDVKASGTVDLVEVMELLEIEKGFSMSGILDFDAQFSGIIQNLDSITRKDISTFKGFGEMELFNGVFKIGGLPTIENVNSKFSVNQSVCRIKQFASLIDGSPTEGIVNIENWLSYLINKSSNLFVTGDLKLEKLQIGNWINESANESAKENVKGKKATLSFPKRVVIKVQLQVSELIYGKVQLQNFKGNVLYKPSRFQLNNTYFNGFGGYSNVDVMIEQFPNHNIIAGKVTTKSVNLETVLETFNDFDQNVVSYKQIKGKLNSTIAFKFKTSRSFEVVKPSILVDADIMVLNGELVEYQLLYNIPSEIEKNKIIALFINLDAFEKRLHHISFDTIKNHLTIENSRLYIPQMSVHSSALSLNLRGWHSFDNQMDYYMNFNLNEVLTKRKKVDSEYGYIVDDDKGNRIMYLHLYTNEKGKVEVDLDKNGIKSHSRLNARKEINETKSILKEELGLFKNDTAITVNNTIDEFEYQVDLGEFGDAIHNDSVGSNLDSVDIANDSTKTDSKKKKKKKKEKKSEFEEWDFDDDDY